MKLSIFGASGFLGTHFIDLNNSNHTSYSCIKIPRDKRLPESKKILYLISTVDNYNVMHNLHVDIDTNLKVLMEVLEHCKEGAYEFNFVSSWFVYGRTRLPARESDYCDPTGFYSITKRCAEQLLVSFCKTYNVNYRILRLCNVYGGVDKKASAKKNALHYMVSLLKNGQNINLYEGGYVLRDYMDVSDVCKAMDLAITKGSLNTVYNIGSGVPICIRQLIEMAKAYLGSKSKIYSVPTPAFHDQVQCRDFYFDVSQLQALGFKPRVSIQEGIEKLCRLI